MSSLTNTNPSNFQTVNVATFGARFGTKGEIYRFLTVEARVYLPDFRAVTIWHMKDLTSGDKSVSARS